MPKNSQIVKVGKRELELSNLEKVFWKKSGYTKASLIDYYLKMSSVILPYLKDRPESLERFPNGVESESFYQKDTDEKLPTWIKTFSFESESQAKTIKYIVCQNKETLIYLANLACISMHPWLSRVDNYKNPDYMVFDLDPEGIDFTEAVRAAQKLHELLNEIGITSVCKTSGKRGLHIFCPTGGKYNYEQVRNFAQLICLAIHNMLPETTSIERLPSKRPNKVYLDFLQNRRGQTMASVYSLRPTINATVSAPLKWEEVNEDLNPLDFRIDNMETRVKQVGDCWKPVQGRGFNLETALKRLEKIFFNPKKYASKI